MARPAGYRRQLVPLLPSSAVLMVLLALLPSSFNLPQSNPGETLEYAPVPPEDDSPPDSSGNFSALGLGSSSGIRGAAPGEAGMDPGASPGGGVGKNPATKRCVGNPPRQTEDPMSPPCVAHYQGDNFGATARGVSRDEVVILVYKDGEEPTLQSGPAHDYWFDLSQPETEEEREAVYPASWRIWQRYFNERYQTYGRFVRIWYHLGALGKSAEQRHADVAEAVGKIDPFAVVAQVNQNGHVYVNDWARRGKVVFVAPTAYGEPAGVDESFYRRYPGRIWGFRPSMQQLADSYGGFLCAQIAPHRVSFSGDGSMGQPRRIGLLGTRDPNEQAAVDFGRLIRRRIEGCGGTVAADEAAPTGGGAERAQEIEVQLARMRQAGVTTIVYTTGFQLGYSQAIAKYADWRPEWVLLEQDVVASTSAYENQDVFRYARHFTTWPRAARESEQPCYQARWETDQRPAHSLGDFACFTYPYAQMLFTGIQVAGPRLTVRSMDRGFHAIPPLPSEDPRVPACFFDEGDYTCVKDAQRQWWDPSDRADGAHLQGCWKSMEDGMRYLADSWPRRDLESDRAVDADGCNVQGVEQ